jgi:hypothetical protein
MRQRGARRGRIPGFAAGMLTPIFDAHGSSPSIRVDRRLSAPIGRQCSLPPTRMIRLPKLLMPVRIVARLFVQHDLD